MLVWLAAGGAAAVQRAGGRSAPGATLAPRPSGPAASRPPPAGRQAARAAGTGRSSPRPLDPSLAPPFQAIKAFEEAVAGMQVGGIRRIEVPGSRPELGYSLERRERFTDDLVSADLKVYK